MKFRLLNLFMLVFGVLSCNSEQRPSALPPPPPAAPPPAERKPPVPPRPDTVGPGAKAPASPDSRPLPKSGAAHGTGAAGGVLKDAADMEMAKPAPPAAYASPRSGYTGFADLGRLDSSLLFEIRYATTNNFTKAKIYDCPRCLLRTEAAEALLKAHRALRSQGLGLKLFDCYRPRPYQQRLWDKVPDPDYVTPPAQGSMHSRGAAVDLTIVDAAGNELDMGTPYDFFGREAHFDYGRLPAKVLANRRLLRKTMMDAGFEGIRTEWWHFSYRKKAYPLSDFVWDCYGQ